MPSFVPTLCHSRTFHRCKNGVRLRVNVPLGRRKVAVAGKISEGVRVHVGRPAREARMPERVKREARDVGDRVRFCVRFLSRRFLDMPTFCWRRENPIRSRCQLASLY